MPGNPRFSFWSPVLLLHYMRGSQSGGSKQKMHKSKATQGCAQQKRWAGTRDTPKCPVKDMLPSILPTAAGCDSLAMVSWKGSTAASWELRQHFTSETSNPKAKKGVSDLNFFRTASRRLLDNLLSSSLPLRSLLHTAGLTNRDSHPGTPAVGWDSPALWASYTDTLRLQCGCLGIL